MVWYEYNSFGQLSGVSTDTGMQASYTYDATGRRASKTVNGVEKRHLWNGDRISAEADANDAITDTYYQLGSLSAHETAKIVFRRKGVSEYDQ